MVGCDGSGSAECDGGGTGGRHGIVSVEREWRSSKWRRRGLFVGDPDRRQRESIRRRGREGGSHRGGIMAEDPSFSSVEAMTAAAIIEGQRGRKGGG